MEKITGPSPSWGAGGGCNCLEERGANQEEWLTFVGKKWELLGRILLDLKSQHTLRNTAFLSLLEWGLCFTYCQHSMGGATTLSHLRLVTPWVSFVFYYFSLSLLTHPSVNCSLASALTTLELLFREVPSFLWYLTPLWKPLEVPSIWLPSLSSFLSPRHLYLFLLHLFFLNLFLKAGSPGSLLRFKSEKAQFAPMEFSCFLWVMACLHFPLPVRNWTELLWLLPRVFVNYSCLGSRIFLISCWFHLLILPQIHFILFIRTVLPLA